MWIKRSLVIVPIVLFLFLGIAVFWVPNTEAVSTNEGRKNRLVFYMGGNPEDMNPWTSTKTTDSDISDYFFEGLVRYNKMYQIEPWLAHSVAVQEDVVATVPANSTPEQFEAQIRAEFGGAVQSIKVEDLKPLPAPEGDALKSLEKAGLKSAAEEFAKASVSRKALRVQLRVAMHRGKITSAVQPDFAAKLEARAGGALYPEFDVDTAAKAAFDALAEDARKESSPEKLATALRQYLEASEFEALTHYPVLQCEIHKGIHWTDGPFFTDPARTFLVSLDGDEVGNIVADSAEAAIAIAKEQLAKSGIDGNFTARTYDKRFGDEPDGPWWGRGPELTARDPKLTIELVSDPAYASPRRSQFEQVFDIRTDAADPYRFEVVYKGLYSPAVGDLAFSILPYHAWNNRAWAYEAAVRGNSAKDMEIAPEKYNPRRVLRTKDRNFIHHPSYLGSMLLQPMNGKEKPYWENNQRVRLRRNEFYWNRKPEYQFTDYMIFDPQYGVETAEQAFLGGDMDVYGADAHQVRRYEQMDEQYYVIKRQTRTYTYIGFNMERKTLSDKRVRLALSMAIDVDEIINYVVNGQGQRISGPTSPVLPWYNDNFRFDHTWLTGAKKGQTEQLKYVPFDLVEAKALLLDAGYRELGGQLVDAQGNPFKLEFRNSTGKGPRQNIAQLATEKWRQLGITVEYKEYEWNDFIVRIINPGDFDACVLGWSLGLDFDQRQLWGTKYRPTDGLNFIAYSNPEVDKLMEDILKVYDYDEQVKMSHRIFDGIAADFPYIFLYSPLATTIVDKHLVWRKQVGTAPDGSPVLQDTALTDPDITNAKATWRYWEPELLRREEVPEAAK